jgi:signal transduction histidine kinase
MAVPLEKLRTFREKLDLTEGELASIEPYREAFTRRSAEFAEHFYSTFYDIPETRMILRHEKRPGFLKKAWAGWFEAFFRGRPDDGFLSFLWRVGMRHVEVNLDQRFSNLGFSVIRHYCHGIARAEVPPEDRVEVLGAIDKLVDLCVLVETSAYIEGTTHCDIEIINAIADKIRNPVTIIGGNMMRLLHKVEKGDPLHETYEYIVSQSQKCGRMVEDVKVYNELFRAEARFQKVEVKGLVETALGRLFAEEAFEGLEVDTDVRPEAESLYGDPAQLGHAFHYLLENSLEAAAGADRPLVRISATTEGAPPHSAVLEIFNTGEVAEALDMDRLASPFYSTKAAGSGFGLAIVKLVVKKHFGEFAMVPMPGEGTKVVLTLPVYEEGVS